MDASLPTGKELGALSNRDGSSDGYGIISNPFLEQAFRTDRYTIKVDLHADGTWSYEQDTLLTIPGQSETFHHTDRNRLRKIAEPTPNPTALAAQKAAR